MSAPGGGEDALSGLDDAELKRRLLAVFDDGMELTRMQKATGIQVEHVIVEATHIQCAMVGVFVIQTQKRCLNMVPTVNKFFQ